MTSQVSLKNLRIKKTVKYLCLRSNDKMVCIELVQAISSTLMHGFQESWHSCLFETFFSCQLKVKVTLESQTIKWSLASVNIIN